MMAKKLVDNHQFIEAVLFCFYQDDSVLLEDRGKGFENEAFFPNGKIEEIDRQAGHNYLDIALIREVKEEFSSQIKIQKKQYLGEVVVPEIKVIFYVYIITKWTGIFPTAIVEAGEPNSQIKFFSITETKKLLKYQSGFAILKLVNEYLMQTK